MMGVNSVGVMVLDGAGVPARHSVSDVKSISILLAVDCCATESPPFFGDLVGVTARKVKIFAAPLLGVAIYSIHGQS